MRIAIVGSGPAGSYAAGLLLRHRDPEIHVDVYERLPTPWGLVRAGVAPDHPNIKTVTRVFEKTAEHPRYRYFGNVELGVHVSREELLERYRAVVYAVGTPTDRTLGIPGDDLVGSSAATAFVGWYNGHPDYANLRFDLSAERVVVIGNGNVALDVARVLSLSKEELSRTDIADHALAALSDSTVREVVVVGRRGPEQAAFTNPELLELGGLRNVDIIVDPAEMAVTEAHADPSASATARRNVDILREYATRRPTGKSRRIVLRFLHSPLAVRGRGRAESIVLCRNELWVGPDGALQARPTAQHVEVSTRLVLRAIGYRGTALPGVLFDEGSGLIPSERGRVLGCPAEYAVGWIKRGPSGVIGTNKKDAQDTVASLLEDLAAARLPPQEHVRDGEIEHFLRQRQPHLITYRGWEAIDTHERAAGQLSRRPRVKLTRVEDMLAIARQ